MSQKFDFGNLVELCRRTHEETQRSATQAVDRSLWRISNGRANNRVC